MGLNGFEGSGVPLIVKPFRSVTFLMDDLPG